LMQMFENEELFDIAAKVNTKFKKVLKKL